MGEVRTKHSARESFSCAALQGQQEQVKRLPSAERVWRRQQQQQQQQLPPPQQPQVQSQLQLRPLPPPPRKPPQPQTSPQPAPPSREQQRQQHVDSDAPLAPLGPGAAVCLRGRHFRITQPLGKGSFGVVWAAEDERGCVVALKEIPCNSESELGKVAAEGMILKQAGQEVASAGLPVGAIPALVATETERSSKQWRVRLAMSLVPGISLESFLEARKKEAKLRGPCSVDEARQQFAESCMCAGELLMQLAPVIDAISASVYHRDITPRNIQFQEQNGLGGPQFGLVDFGLAVDAKRWRAGEPGAGQLGGDGRYWPASSWYVFCYGSRALERDAVLHNEYRTSLDAHSLGLSALRCFVEMLPASGAPRAVEEALQKLRVAWQRYWHDARKLWQPIFDAFCGKGNFDELRASFTRAKVHCIISDDLCALRGALRTVQHVCSGLPIDTGLSGMPALCQALLLMVQAGRADDLEANPAVEPEQAACRPARLSSESAELEQCPSSTASPSSSPSASASSGTSCY